MSNTEKYLATAEVAENDHGMPTAEIDAQGVALLQEAYWATLDLAGKDLTAALDTRFAELKARDELVGGDDIKHWGESDDRHHEVSLVIKPLEGVAELSDEDRERVAIVQTLYVAHLLGTPWRRAYENEGEPIQHVRPVSVDYLDVESSQGGAPLWPHNEILPTADNRIICSKFSTLFGVHNTNSGTATTLYDAQAALAEITDQDPDMLQRLMQTDFEYIGTLLEKAAEHTQHQRVPMVQPVYGKDGALLSYDLITDLDDGQTMDGIDDDSRKAMYGFRDYLMKHETAYVIKDGEMLVWDNRKALHGRRPVTDMQRHLVRSQVGEAEHAGANADL